jgi:hypothetical protein
MSMDFHVGDGIDVRKFETLTGLAGAVVAPSAANLTLDGLPCKTITVTVESGDVRWKVDGGVPSVAAGDGHLAEGPASFSVGNPGNVNRLQFYVIADAVIALSFGF